jgi:putative transposase
MEKQTTYTCYPPKLSLSVLVNALKGASSRMLRKARPDGAGRVWKGVRWTPAYVVGSPGGATWETVKRYVDQQRAASLA